MNIVGQVSSKEEADEIQYIAKTFAVGRRAGFLGEQSKKIKKEHIKPFVITTKKVKKDA